MADPIRFGTNGWRGTLADEITGPRVRALAAAVAEWLTASGGRRVWVAHDTRFLGPTLTATAAGVLSARGLAVTRVRSPIATPVVTHALGRGRADAALVFTASHNPAADHGVKVIDAGGASISPSGSRRLERLAARALRGAAIAAAPPPRRWIDPRPAYLRSLRAQLDGDALRRGRVAVVYDAMHGAGAGLCDAALRDAGVRVESLRADADPRFGGSAPDLAPAHLLGLIQRVRAGGGRWLGLANDGDADRFAVVDRDGTVLTETEALALLVDHLARSGRALGGLAISLATGTLVEQVAREHGIAVERHPIGFKYLSGALRRGRASLAGEESGGFALGAHGIDKDGVLAACLIAELAALDPRPLGRRLRALERRYGVRTCGRTALAGDDARRARMESLRNGPPDRVDGQPVRSVDLRDGFRLELADGFVMLRDSGTEPLIRVYAEAPGRAALRRRLEAGRRLLVAGRGDRRGRRGGVG